MDPGKSFLLTDLYQLAMMQGYLEACETGTAVFEFFVRKLPDKRNFLVAAGLEQVLEYLENLQVNEEELARLSASGQVRGDLKRFALNLNRLTLPEIRDFNALSDASWFKLNAKRSN